MDIRAKLARSTAEHFVRTRQAPPITHRLPPELSLQRACYVYLYQKPGQRLRALYGQPLPRCSSLAEEIVANTINAISASTYLTIRRADLSSLVYSIAVLESLQRISDLSHLDPHTYGLYVSSDRGKSAVLLPQRPGIDTPQEQYATALRESGIQHEHEVTALYRFNVTYYE